MQLFVLTNHCTSRAHCNTCRDLDGGRSWREGLKKYFHLPQDTVDFTCPHGLQWKQSGEKIEVPYPQVKNTPVNPVPKTGSTPPVKTGCAPCARKANQSKK